MNSQFSVPIPNDLYVRVEDFLHTEGKTGDPVAAIAQAVDNWIAQARTKVIAPPADAGQWSNDWIMFSAPPKA